MGVVGGNNNGTVDGSESVLVELSQPGFASYFVSSAANLDSDGLVGEATLEAWDTNGESLGVVNVDDAGNFDVSALFGGAIVSRFQVRASVDSIRIATVTLDTCD